MKSHTIRQVSQLTKNRVSTNNQAVAEIRLFTVDDAALHFFAPIPGHAQPDLPHPGQAYGD